MQASDDQIDACCKAHFEGCPQEDAWTWEKLPEPKRRARRERMRAAIAVLLDVEAALKAAPKPAEPSPRFQLTLDEYQAAHAMNNHETRGVSLFDRINAQLAKRPAEPAPRALPTFGEAVLSLPDMWRRRDVQDVSGSRRCARELEAALIHDGQSALPASGASTYLSVQAAQRVLLGLTGGDSVLFPPEALAELVNGELAAPASASGEVEALRIKLDDAERALFNEKRAHDGYVQDSLRRAAELEAQLAARPTLDGVLKIERERDEARAQLGYERDRMRVTAGKLQRADDYIESLEEHRDELRAQIAKLETACDEAKRKADDHRRQRDEARSELHRVTALYDRSRSQAERALEAECAQLRAQLAARTVPVVIDEALAKSLWSSYYVTHGGQPGSVAMLSALRHVLGNTVSVAEPSKSPVVVDEAFAQRIIDCATYDDGFIRPAADVLNALKSALDGKMNGWVPKPHPGPLTPEREAELRKKPAHYCVHELFPTLDWARAELIEAQRKLTEAFDNEVEGGHASFQREQQLRTERTAICELFSVPAHADDLVDDLRLWRATYERQGKALGRCASELERERARYEALRAGVEYGCEALERHDGPENKTTVFYAEHFRVLLKPAAPEPQAPDVETAKPAVERDGAECPAAWLCDTQNSLLLKANARVEACEQALRRLRAYHRTHLVSLAEGSFSAQAARHALAYFDEQVASALGPPSPGTAGAHKPALPLAPQAPGWQHVSSDGDSHTFRHGSTGEERVLEGFPTADAARPFIGDPVGGDVLTCPLPTAVCCYQAKCSKMGRRERALALSQTEPVQGPPPDERPASLRELCERIHLVEGALRCFLTSWTSVDSRPRPQAAVEALAMLGARKTAQNPGAR